MIRLISITRPRSSLAVLVHVEVDDEIEGYQEDIHVDSPYVAGDGFLGRPSE